MQIAVEILGASKVSVFLDTFPSETGKAILRALKRGTDSAATHAGRVVASDMGLKIGDVRKRVRVIPPTGETLAGELRGSLKRIPLIDFAKRSKVPHAFPATMPSGHRGIFVRSPLHSTRRGPKPNRSGLPIRELLGPSVGRVLSNHQGEILARGSEVFLKEFDRLLDRIIQGSAGVGDA